MSHEAPMILRVCKGLEIDGLVWRGNFVPIPIASSIDVFVLPRHVFTFIGFPVSGFP